MSEPKVRRIRVRVRVRVKFRVRVGARVRVGVRAMVSSIYFGAQGTFEPLVYAHRWPEVWTRRTREVRPG